ncbi:DUF6286 domain-containing protein [Streptomyces sp. NPDC058872]|uniref:DUF6286 domain-containing protein n=1 Tax=Streptomyces sp. NPDC058872 TaxID=3346661 RepID=UPI00369761E5
MNDTVTPPGRLGIADRAVRKVLGRAVGEALPPGGRVTRTSARVQGRRARTAVGVALRVDGAGSATRAVRAVRDHASARTERLTGLRLTRLRVDVTGLRLPGPVPSVPAQAAAPEEGRPAERQRRSAVRKPHRSWSPRRVPASVLAWSVALASGSVAYGAVQSGPRGGPADTWRPALAHAVVRYGPASTGVAAALLTAALGALLIVLAVTPGHRGRWPASTAPELPATVDRNVIASLVREAVAAAPGVTRVRVRVGRRHVTVRAVLLFGDLPAASRMAERAAERALASCCLCRPPKPRVRVRPDVLWTPSHGRADEGRTPRLTESRGGAA